MAMAPVRPTVQSGMLVAAFTMLATTAAILACGATYGEDEDAAPPAPSEASSDDAARDVPDAGSTTDAATDAALNCPPPRVASGTRGTGVVPTLS
jgi:hypothetical protein